MKDTPFVAFGNDELGERVGDKATCPNCKKKHKVEYGELVNKDENGKEYRVPSKMLGAVSCKGSHYLVSLDEKLIK